jgi:hypothetical protein
MVRVEALRPSWAKKLLDHVPAKALAAIREPWAPTPAMRKGTAVDDAAFSDRPLSREFPELLPAVAASKAALAKVLEWHNATGVYQQRLTWECNGVPCFGTPDAIAVSPDGSKRIIDLKTCASATDDAIERSFRNYHYALQLAAYTEAAGAVGPAYIVWQETCAPYLARVSVITPEAIDRGMRDWHRAVNIWKRCCESGEWPGYDTHEML